MIRGNLKWNTWNLKSKDLAHKYVKNLNKE